MSTKLIVVEDDAASVMLLKRYLKRADWHPEVIHFEYGADAIDYFQNTNDSDAVLLLDLNLPDLHGTDILKTIRMQDALDSMSVVVLTTSNLEHERATCEDLGIDHFLEKPFSLKALVALMHTLDLQVNTN
ncbi:MAG: response regulator [Chloroflexota bacterium]